MKTKICFGLLALVFALGCSNDELVNNPTENNQLQKSSGLIYLGFFGNSIDDNNYFALPELADGSKILKNGKCSGTIKGYGRINPNLSNYSFVNCNKESNPEYEKGWSPWENIYILVGGGKVSLNTVDYFEFSIIRGIYSQWNYDPDMYKGAIFICNNYNQGEAKITNGSGKFKAFTGKPLEIYRAGGETGIDRLSGKMYLQFYIRN
jgi:hypothetical protein